MNKILLNNFPKVSEVAHVVDQTNKGKEFDIIYGFDLTKDLLELKTNVVSQIITSLLIHDKIVVNTPEFMSFLNIFGIDNTLKILRENIIELINDHGLSVFARINKGEIYEVRPFSLVSNSGDDLSSLSYLEERLSTQIADKNKINQLMVLLSKNLINLNISEVYKLLDEEINYDLNNKNVINNYGLNSNNYESIHKNDIYKVLRISHINKGLIFSSLSGANNILIEAEIQKILEYKISPSIQTKNKNQSIPLFENLIEKKGIPDLGSLLLKEAMSIDDILELRNNFHGKLFREWFFHHDYQEKLVFKELLNKKKEKFSSKLLRIIYPNVIGIFNPILGTLSGLVDGMIVDKMVKGWHPSIFLDNNLKVKIDNRLESYRRTQERKDFEVRFGKVSRNEPCPCGSKKKFKKCHGKDLF